MKKILFGTTALAAAIAAGSAAADGHEGVTVEFSGFSSVWFNATSIDNGKPFSGVGSGSPSNNNIPLTSGIENQGFTDYHELYWRAAYQVDGIGEIGHRSELRYFGNQPSSISLLGGTRSFPVAGLSIDESYIFIEGDFGQFQIGDTDNAADTMFVTMAGDNTAIGGYGGAIQDLDNAQAVVNGASLTVTTTVETTGIGLSSDAAKIVYFTPRFGDLVQFGFSYAPGSANANGSTTSTGENVEDYLAAGVNLTTEIGGVNIQAAAGVERGEFQGDPGTSVLDEVGRYGAGIKASWQGIEVGGSFNNREFEGQDTFGAVNNGAAGLNRNEADQTNWEVGAAYSGAPHWRVGVTYAESEQGDREVDYWGVGARFAVHPAVIFFAGYNKSDNNLSGNSLPTNGATFVDGTGFNGDRARTYGGMLVRF